MRIESSAVSMASSRNYYEEKTVKSHSTQRWHGDGVRAAVTHDSVSTTLRVEQEHGAHISVRTGTLPEQGEQNAAALSDTAGGATGSPVTEQETSTVRESQKSSNRPQNTEQIALPSESTDWLAEARDKIENDPKIKMLRKMLELLERYTGKKFSDPLADTGRGAERSAMRYESRTLEARLQQASVGYGFVRMGKESAPTAAGALQELKPQIQIQVQPVNGYWTRQVDQSITIKGAEETTFSSKGTVVTSDGRNIDFGIHLQMSRDFEEGLEIHGKEEVFTDPLIINMDTDATELSDVTFRFDLNGDGEKEEISQLKSGSGFLAFDRNGDGKINDGTELFGAATGNGFAELSQYDQDGNGWIDENDDIFSKLSVWVQCGDGDGKLLSLKDADVGAIYLGSQKTQFSLADSYGDVNAMVRRTGVYLRESGTVGTVQHVDLKSQDA